jgi:Fic family protein
LCSPFSFLSSRPVLSVSQVSESLEMPFKTANAYLAKLERAGVLREITGYARNRIFQAYEILSVVREDL